MEEIIGLIQNLKSLEDSKTQEYIDQYNALMRNHETPAHLQQFLLQSPESDLSPIVLAVLTRCTNLICSNYLDELVLTFLQNLVILYYNVYPQIETSLLIMYRTIAFSRSIYFPELTQALIESLQSDNMLLIQKAAYSLPYVVEIECSHLNNDDKLALLNTLWESISTYRDSLDNETSCLVLAFFFKAMRKCVKSFIALMKANEMILQYIYALLQNVAQSADQIDNPNSIFLFRALFKIIYRVISQANVDYECDSQEIYFVDVLIPFVHEILEIQEPLFERLAYKSITKHFLNIIQQLPSSVDISQFINFCVQLCVFTCELDEEDLSLILENGSLYYSIAFEKTNFKQSARDIANQTFADLFSKYPNEIFNCLEDIDSEPKIRLLAEIVGKHPQLLTEEMIEKTSSLIMDVFNSSVEPQISSCALFLCSKFITFANEELSNFIFTNVVSILSSFEKGDECQDEIFYLLICEIVTNNLAANKLINDSEEITMEVCNNLTNFDFFSTYIGLHVFSTGFSRFPSLFHEHVNEYLSVCLSIISERLEINEELERDNDWDSNLLSLIFEYVKPCIENCFDEVEFEPLFEVISRFADNDYPVEFYKILEIFHIIAFHEETECEAVCVALIQQFICDDDDFSIISENLMLFFLIQINHNTQHFIEFYSDKTDFLLHICSYAQQFLRKNSAYPIEYYYILMFFSRLVQLSILTGDSASEILQICMERLNSCFLSSDMRLGNDRVSRMGLFEFIASCIIVGIEVDLSPIIGKWAQLARTNGFPTDYERALQVTAVEAFLSSSDRNDNVFQAVQNLCLNQNISMDIGIDHFLEKAIRIQNLISDIPFIPENFVSLNVPPLIEVINIVSTEEEEN